QDGEPETFVRGRLPAIIALPAAGGLVFSKDNKTLWNIRSRHLQNNIIGRRSFREDNDLTTNSGFTQRCTQVFST
ncbi:MAG: hypothetical protein ABJB22_06180, partial [Verrucomicrobiota bacterium]